MKQKPVVLVVDDDLKVRRFVTRILEANDFDVTEAGTAMECLEVLQSREGAIDVLIADLVMPHMGGLDLTAEISRRYPNLKVLYMSGYGSSVAVQSIAYRAPEGILLKPFTEEMLVDRVRGLCQRD